MYDEQGTTKPGIMFEIRINDSTGVDASLEEIFPHMRKLFKLLKIRSVNVIPDYRIKGRSWEMACVMCALGYTGVYTGTVSSFNAHKVLFGPVSDVDIKERLDENLQTYIDIPYVPIPG